MWPNYQIHSIRSVKNSVHKPYQLKKNYIFKACDHLLLLKSESMEASSSNKEIIKILSFLKTKKFKACDHLLLFKKKFNEALRITRLLSIYAKNEACD